MIPYTVALLCVIGLAIGQILFKLSASTLQQTGTLVSMWGMTTLLGALLLYSVTSLAWVWVLQKIELGRIYPLMALAFVLVPIGSHLVFGERFNYHYYFGVAIIVLGIIISQRA